MALAHIPAAQFQIEFVSYLQRMLVEGNFVSTYKFALLHAIADICIENPTGGGVISLDQLAEKFLELYWQHSLPYSATGEGTTLLHQNTDPNKQVTLLTDLSVFREQKTFSFSQVKQSPDWDTLLKSAKKALKDGPIWRLQILQRQPVCFLYPHSKNSTHIELNEGVVYCFQRFYDLVTSLARSHWLQKIRSIPVNRPLIGDKGDLDDFLFGSSRVSLAKIQPLLLYIQQGCCFYCGKPLKKSTTGNGTGEVDHFIPWARYPNDLGHNFVLAHSGCNNNKSASLASRAHMERWHEQNIIQQGDVISRELNAFFTCDAERSVAVVQWMYQLAQQNNVAYWSEGKDFVDAEGRLIVPAGIKQ